MKDKELTKTERTEMIDTLIANLRAMNRDRVIENPELASELDEICEGSRNRYEGMTDMQLRNMLLINC